jgi:hypothetical protein
MMKVINSFSHVLNNIDFLIKGKLKIQIRFVTYTFWDPPLCSRLTAVFSIAGVVHCSASSYDLHSAHILSTAAAVILLLRSIDVAIT